MSCATKGRNRMYRVPCCGSRPKSGRFALAASVSLGLTSCTYVDRFGGRAVSYNIEAEQVKDQDLILNIVRAAYRKPMQFTDLSTISGQATASFTGGLSLLLGAAPSGSAVANSASPSATLSGGPTFAVGTLNTKEFYEGILAPIPMSTIDYYASQGFPLQLLLSLLIAEIDTGQPEHPTRIYGQADTQDNWNNFREFLSTLLAHGLASETVPSVKAIGPPLTSEEARDPRRIAELKAQKLDLVEHAMDKPDPNLSTAERDMLRAKGASVYYRIEEDDSSPRFCFRPSMANLGPPISINGGIIPESSFCGADKLPSPVPKAAGRLTLVAQTYGSPEIVFKTRSVEGVIYFLGEIARAELHPGDPSAKPFVPWLPTAPRQQGTESPPTSTCNVARDILFSIDHVAMPGAISTNYEGTNYSVPVDLAGCDRSAQVLEIVAQLLALNSSAKDLPTPNIIPLITR